MKLQEIMSKDVKTVGPETSLRVAAGLMKEEGIGMLPVVGLGQTPLGVITDRDIAIRAFASGIPSSAPVREAMTNEVHTILQDRELDEALALMEKAKVGRVLVCDQAGRLTGVLSLGDATVACKGDGRTTRVSEALAQRNRHVVGILTASLH